MSLGDIKIEKRSIVRQTFRSQFYPVEAVKNQTNLDTETLKKLDT